MTTQEKIDALVSMYNQNKFEDLVNEAEKLLLGDPGAFVIWNILGAAQMAQGKFPEAAEKFRQAARLQPQYADAHYNLGVTLHEQGKLEEAISAYGNAFSVNPFHVAACYNAGNALRDLGENDKALHVYRRALEIQPLHADACYNMGNILQDVGRLEEAVAAYQRTITIREDHAKAHYNLGNALRKQGKLPDAINAYRGAVSIDPNYAEAYSNLGDALRSQGEHDEAVSSYLSAIRIKPDIAEAHLGVGNSLKSQGRLEEAVAAYQRAIAIRPSRPEAYVNMGSALEENNQLEAAVQAYRGAIGIDPKSADAHNGIGTCLAKQEKFSEALDAYLNAIKLKPQHAETYNNLGAALANLGQVEDAISAYKRCLEIQPDLAVAEAVLLHQQKQVCDFSIDDRLQEASARLGITTQPIPPFVGLPWSDNPEQQLERAIAWAGLELRAPAPAFAQLARAGSDRIRIGYFSSDFHDHATMYLIAGLLREHDADEFEVFVYSYGRVKSGNLRKRLENELEHFFDVENLSDPEIAKLARSHGLDIAVDLKGYTQFGRSGIFQYRPAPIQVNYLGYPGSMGSKFIDYIVADPVVIPDTYREFYAERIIYLPHSYQPNDDTREVADTSTTRADFFLPETGIVFCCFNNNYKISPAEFSVWMRLLHRVEGSVIWLFQSNTLAEQNLRRHALASGIDPSRLVFASKLPHSEHLARHKHADIFLDTFNYNAHTTASDALWAGVPVVTKIGRQFSARVAASLLTASGLPELIAKDDTDYEEMIFALAQDPFSLQSITGKLMQSKKTAPLFDTKRYTRNFESGMRAAFRRLKEGSRPADIRVKG